MADKVTVQQVADRVGRLLDANEGIFIGESHGYALAVDFIQSHRKMMTAKGVGVLYIENSAFFARSGIGGAACRQQFLEAPVSLGENVDYELRLIKVAISQGWRVIGHDSLNMTSATIQRSINEPNFFRRLAETGEGLDRRDDYSAKLISQTKVGDKYIVFGGAAHGKLVPSDLRPSGKVLADRLDIPAVNFYTPTAMYKDNMAWQALFVVGSHFQMKYSKEAPIYIATMDGQKSGLKVTSWNQDAFKSKEQELSMQEEKIVEEVRSLVKAQGVCTPLKGVLKNKPLLDLSDIDASLVALPTTKKEPKVRH